MIGSLQRAARRVQKHPGMKALISQKQMVAFMFGCFAAVMYTAVHVTTWISAVQ